MVIRGDSGLLVLVEELAREAALCCDAALETEALES